MEFRSRPRFNFTLCLGFIALAVANIGKFVLERHTSLPEGPRDGIAGFLMGAAIALMLLGIWRMKREGPSSTSGCDWRTSNR